MDDSLQEFSGLAAMVLYHLHLDRPSGQENSHTEDECVDPRTRSRQVDDRLLSGEEAD